MRTVIIVSILLLSAMRICAQQQPVMRVSTDKDIYFPDDSLHWQCALDGFGRRFNTVTLQLRIERLRDGSRWQYRFPVINGYTEGAIHIGKDVPPGRYAVNFLLQGDFFNISGRLSRPRARDSVLSYLVLFRDKETMVKQVRVAGDGTFDIGGLVYQDTAMFSFSRPGRNTEPPAISISTSLDSAFTPAVPVITRFINIGGAGGAADSGIAGDIRQSKEYHFDLGAERGRQLAEIVVRDRRSGKLLKDYQDAYVTAGFNTADAIVLDGLSNDDILKSGNIYNYLMMHVPGLTASMNTETGAQELKWRNTTPAIYVDEFRQPDDMPLTVMPGEVAMIKIFRPGSGPLTGGNSSNGAIAIYTKVGPYSRFLPAADPRSRFFIRGYSGLSADWNAW